MDTNRSSSNKNATGNNGVALVKRYLKLFLISILIVGSLISFPNTLPIVVLIWIIADWIVNRSTMPDSRRWITTRLPGFVCLAIIGTKFPEPTWSLGVFCGVLALALVNPKERRNGTTAIVFAGWSIFAVMFWFGAHSSSQSSLDPSRPIVCLGDSLTDFGYPDALRKLVSVPVEDFGYNGYTTTDAIKLLPEIVKLNPQVVVVELGGHDYKDGEPRFRTYENLIHVIETCEQAGARVILVEIPRGLVNDPYFGLERQIAREKDLELIPDTMIRRLIYWSPILPPGSMVSPSIRNSDDGLHPNDRGNRMMARYVLSSLEAIYGKEIRGAQ